MSSVGVSFRPIEDEDLPFLLQVYATTRAEELAAIPWEDDQKTQFLAQQFAAQHRHYQEHFPAAEYLVILLDGRPIGRFYIDRRADEIRVIDIALLPENRRAGIGGSLMQEAIAEGRQTGKPVRIHVERNNPALRLYERLGFRKLEERGIYDLMEWSPADSATGDADQLKTIS